MTFKLPSLDFFFRTVDMNQVQCCKSGIFDVAVHSSVGVRAYSMTRDENCNSFSSGNGQQLYLGLFSIFRTDNFSEISLAIIWPSKIENSWQPKVNKSGSLLKIGSHLLLQMRWPVTVVHWLNCRDFEVSIQVLVIWRFVAEKRPRRDQDDMQSSLLQVSSPNEEELKLNHKQMLNSLVNSLINNKVVRDW